MSALDKSKYCTVGRSSCLVLVQWMKGQPRTVNPCLFKCHVRIALVHSYVFRVCVCGWVDVWGGGGGRLGEGM